MSTFSFHDDDADVGTVLVSLLYLASRSASVYTDDDDNDDD